HPTSTTAVTQARMPSTQAPPPRRILMMPGVGPVDSNCSGERKRVVIVSRSQPPRPLQTSSGGSRQGAALWPAPAAPPRPPYHGLISSGVVRSGRRIGVRLALILTQHFGLTRHPDQGKMMAYSGRTESLRTWSRKVWLWRERG